jgi:hypothetical protein
MRRETRDEVFFDVRRETRDEPHVSFPIPLVSCLMSHDLLFPSVTERLTS